MRWHQPCCPIFGKAICIPEPVGRYGPPGHFRRQLLRLALSSWLIRTFNVFSRFFPRSVVLHSAGSSLYMRNISSCRFFPHLASAHAPLGFASRRVPPKTSTYLLIISRHSSSVFF